MLPEETFRNFDALRWLLRHFLGLKTSLGSRRFSLGMVIRFTTTRMEIGVQRHRRFQVHPWNWAKKRRTKASQYFVTLNLIQSNSRQECVATALTICLFSDLRSSLSRSDREVRAGTNLCWRYACFLPTSEGYRQHHLSQNIGPAIVGLPDLLRQPCQKEMNT